MEDFKLIRTKVEAIAKVLKKQIVINFTMEYKIDLFAGEGGNFHHVRNLFSSYDIKKVAAFVDGMISTIRLTTGVAISVNHHNILIIEKPVPVIPHY